MKNTALLTGTIRDASKFLLRDYFELENLQSSARSRKNFVEKAQSRVAENLQKSLGKYYNTIIFYNNVSDLKTLDFVDQAALVDVLDGASNFERSIPFFAVVVTILIKKDRQIMGDKVVMNFPGLGDIYYAEQGKGAWLERNSSNFGATRLRVSVNNKLEDSLISCGNKQLECAKGISSNIRVFESYAYQAALLTSGKSDCSLFVNNPVLTKGIELLIHEAGGVSYLQDDILIASNYSLQEKLKHFLGEKHYLKTDQ